MIKRNVEPGTPEVNKKYSIMIDTKGPYLVYGRPPMKQQFIVQNEEGISWSYQDGIGYELKDDPTALCRCGASATKPFCDGTHLTLNWDPTLGSDNIPLLDNAEVTDGPVLEVTDNEKYCAFARFCDAYGRIWNLVEESDNPETRDLTIREANYCPAGRLKAFDKEKGEFLEKKLKPALILLEDPQKRCSGPLFVRGAIPIDDTDGVQYEARNRVTLCRCGASSNKPFCDGTHASIHFRDGLPSGPAR